MSGMNTMTPAAVQAAAGRVAVPTLRRRSAHYYAGELGWHVFPCGGDKRPLTPTGFKAATADHDQIDDWWCRWPAALIAVPAGGRSGFIVIDVDRKNGVDGVQSLLARGMALPPTWSVRTRSGGLHFYLAHPGRPVKNAAALRIGGQVLAGVDVRGDGGYVIAPGGRDGYRWSRWRPGRCELAEPPPWLAGHLNPAAPTLPLPRRPGPSGSGANAILEDVTQRIVAAMPGTRNATLAAQAWRAGRLVAEGRVDPGTALAAVIDATRRMNSAATASGGWSVAAAVATAERCFAEGRAHA